jgi:hypothetical protein
MLAARSEAHGDSSRESDGRAVPSADRLNGADIGLVSLSPFITERPGTYLFHNGNGIIASILRSIMRMLNFATPVFAAGVGW